MFIKIGYIDSKKEHFIPELEYLAEYCRAKTATNQFKIKKEKTQNGFKNGILFFNKLVKP